MRLRTLAAVLAGLGAGGAVVRQAASSLGSAELSGAELLIVPAMWAIGMATTAFGSGELVFYGIGLAEFCWRDYRRSKDRTGQR